MRASREDKNFRAWLLNFGASAACDGGIFGKDSDLGTVIGVGGFGIGFLGIEGSESPRGIEGGTASQAPIE